jgi:branched-chain amino acid transport system substrate-binding protein
MNHFMHYFMRFVYRFFAFALLFALAACFMEPEVETEESPPTLSAINPNSLGASTTPPAPVKIPTEKHEDYAPATKINKDIEKPAPGVYAPATSSGETTKAITVKVGLLIPMSGESKALGQSLLDAAVLAIYDKYSALSPKEMTIKIELLPKDTGDTIEGAEKAAQDAIQEGATLLLGPVFSKQVSAIASITRSKNIPVITFSNNVSVAGDGVYLFGFVPEQQVIRIIQYSLSKGLTNIAGLVPSNPYGAAIVKQLSAEVRKSGGRAHPIEYYQEDMSSLNNNVARLSRFLQDESSKHQALFIAEGGDKLKLLAESLATNGINSGNVQLIGTGLWDDTDILKWPTLRGGWFASSPPEKYHAFEQHFVSTYGYRPERRASLSYDAVALAATISIAAEAKGLSKNDLFSRSVLIDRVGFNGPANGIFRFLDDGSIERGLSVLMVTATGFKTVEPAPTLFNQ